MEPLRNYNNDFLDLITDVVINHLESIFGDITEGDVNEKIERLSEDILTDYIEFLNTNILIDKTVNAEIRFNALIENIAFGYMREVVRNAKE